MTDPIPKTTRRSFNRSLLLGGAGLLVSGGCAHSAPTSTAAMEEGILAAFEGTRLRLTYQFSSAVAESVKQILIPATLVVAIDSLTQTPVCRSLSAGPFVERKGPVPIEGGLRWEATLEPRELLGLGAASGLWFLHASVLQYRSGVLALQLAG
ncbi:hypothetical protein [Hyalangium versicolor]|uniref:hypothetical protein n=1 Tax=Hyalangium versicolor TaxID=2861190 RepID=UPI001CCEE547|nr:hypothetical protein [Hyalangium versicolor]